MANLLGRLFGAKNGPEPAAPDSARTETDTVQLAVAALIRARVEGARSMLYSDYAKTGEGRALLALSPEGQ